jgi:hypothetical protein
MRNIIWVDQGHETPGHNTNGKGYFEGTWMGRFGNYGLAQGVFDGVTRPAPCNDNNVSFTERTRRAKEGGADTLISLHTNAPPARGILIIYSYKRPQDRPFALELADKLSKAMGIGIRGVITRKSEKGPWDYYGMIRNPYNAGMIPLIIEHGDHNEFATNPEENIRICTEVYREVFNDMNVRRLYGPNRVATAVAVSKDMYPNGCDNYVIATGENFPDALPAGPLATSLDGPLLYTKKDTLPAETKAEIIRLGATNCTIVGGESAVSQAVQDELDSM